MPVQKKSGNILKAPRIIGVIIHFMFHNFFSSLARSKYPSLFLYFYFDTEVCQDSYLTGSLFLLTRSCLLARIIIIVIIISLSF